MTTTSFCFHYWAYFIIWWWAFLTLLDSSNRRLVQHFVQLAFTFLQFLLQLFHCRLMNYFKRVNLVLIGRVANYVKPSYGRPNSTPLPCRICQIRSLLNGDRLQNKKQHVLSYNCVCNPGPGSIDRERRASRF